jgi:hypothetical protein
MTQQEALIEARRRWGGSAFVAAGWKKHVYAPTALRGVHVIFEGASWEEAYADADRRAASQKGSETNG